MKNENAKKGRKTKAPSTFSKNLKKLLDEKNISMREMSRKIGVSASVLHGWTQGAVPNDTHLVLKLCRELQADFQYMMTGVPSGTVPVKRIEEMFDIEDGHALNGIYVIEAKKLNWKKS
jgi:transcriptional regulator with XRE-family HTH domain